MKTLTLRPDEASCWMCRMGPQNGNSCPLKGRVQAAYLKKERHDCGLFRHITKLQLAKRLSKAAPPAEVEQEALF